MSLLFPRVELLTALPRVLLVHFDPPRPDLERYGDQALGDGVGLARLPVSVGEPNFVQVDLWAGDWPGWQHDRAHGISWALKSDVVERVNSGDQTVQARSVDVTFDTCGVRVVATRPIGRLRSLHDGEPGRLMRLSHLDWTRIGS
jgi:hypothetical protein